MKPVYIDDDGCVRIDERGPHAELEQIVRVVDTITLTAMELENAVRSAYGLGAEWEIGDSSQLTELLLRAFPGADITTHFGDGRWFARIQSRSAANGQLYQWVEYGNLPAHAVARALLAFARDVQEPEDVV